jgi:hypothetical protein
MWSIVPITLLWVALPFLAGRVRSTLAQVCLSLVGAVLGLLLTLLMLATAVFTETLFGRLLSLSIAGVFGFTFTGLLALESLSWVVTDAVGAWRRRGQSTLEAGVVAEEEGEPVDGSAVEGEG